MSQYPNFWRLPAWSRQRGQPVATCHNIRTPFMNTIAVSHSSSLWLILVLHESFSTLPLTNKQWSACNVHSYSTWSINVGSHYTWLSLCKINGNNTVVTLSHSKTQSPMAASSGETVTGCAIFWQSSPAQLTILREMDLLRSQAACHYLDTQHATAS